MASRRSAIERGVPPWSAAQAQVASELDYLGKMQVNFVAAVAKVAVALPPPPPKGADEIEKLILRVADTVAVRLRQVDLAAHDRRP